MKTSRATEELRLFKAVEAGVGDEQSFYALCEYMNFLLDDYETTRLLEKSFKNKGNNLYLNAGDGLLNLIEDGKMNPRAIWSDVLSRNNRSVTLFSKSGMSASVGRTIHQLLASNDIFDESPAPTSKTTVCINKQFHISVKGHENRPFYRPRKGSEPYKIISILTERYLNRAEPISSGALSKKIYGTITKANQIASTIDKLRDNQFKKKLKQDFISNSSGYYLNDDFLSIEIT